MLSLVGNIMKSTGRFFNLVPRALSGDLESDVKDFCKRFRFLFAVKPFTKLTSTRAFSAPTVDNLTPSKLQKLTSKSVAIFVLDYCKKHLCSGYHSSRWA